MNRNETPEEMAIISNLRSRVDELNKITKSQAHQIKKLEQELANCTELHRDLSARHIDVNIEKRQVQQELDEANKKLTDCYTYVGRDVMVGK